MESIEKVDLQRKEYCFPPIGCILDKQSKTRLYQGLCVHLKFFNVFGVLSMINRRKMSEPYTVFVS